MANGVYTLDNSRVWFEDIRQELTYQTGTLSTAGTNNDLVKIEASGVTLKNTDIIHIKGIDGTEKWQGRWAITKYDEDQDLGFDCVFGLTPEDLDGDSGTMEVQFAVVPMLETCLITGGSWNLGSITTAEKKHNCGTTNYSTGKEAGEVSFNFSTNFANPTQSNLMRKFQYDFTGEIQLSLLPPGSTVMLSATVAITGYNFNIDETYETTANFQLRSPTWDIYVPEQ